MHRHLFRFTDRNLPYFFLSPTLVFITVIMLYPIMKAMAMSLREIDLLRPGMTPFIGLENYLDMLSKKDFWNSLYVTTVYTLGTASGSYLIGLVTALLVNSQFPGRGLARSILIIPWAIPAVVTSIIWTWMYDYQYGIINYLLTSLKVIPGNLVWLTSPDMALIAVLLGAIWRNFPIATVMLLAGLQSIPLDIYEAAEIDGANWLQRIRYVTLPGLKSVSSILILLLTIWTFKNFEFVFVMTGGGPARRTETLVIQVYLEAFKYFNMGYASAIGITILLISLAFSVIYLWFTKAFEGGV